MGNCKTKLVKTASQLVYISNPTDFPIRINLIGGQINADKINQIDRFEAKNEYMIMPEGEIRIESETTSHIVITQGSKRCIFRLPNVAAVTVHLNEIDVELSSAVVHDLGDTYQEIYYKFLTMMSS